VTLVEALSMLDLARDLFHLPLNRLGFGMLLLSAVRASLIGMRFDTERGLGSEGKAVVG
jgi:hypothetical protein